MKQIRCFLLRYKTALLMGALSFTLVCCSTKYLIPTQADVPIVQAQWPGTTLSELTNGYNIYADKCTDCHNLKKPQAFSADDWNNNYMPKMGLKAKLDNNEYKLVLRYILTKREEITSSKK